MNTVSTYTRGLWAHEDGLPSACRYCDGSQFFYSDPDLGPCVCADALPPVSARFLSTEYVESFL